MTKELEKWDAEVSAVAAWGLEPPAPAQEPPAITRQELMRMGIPADRVEEIYQKLAHWAKRNPAQNKKPILAALAKGYSQVR